MCTEHINLTHEMLCPQIIKFKTRVIGRSLCRILIIAGYLFIMYLLGFTAFSLPGQFAPGSESANRTLANSLPGTFVPWPIRSLALSLLGLLAPWYFRSPERNGPGTLVPWNFRTQEYSLPGTFAPTELSFPVSP